MEALSKACLALLACCVLYVTSLGVQQWRNPPGQTHPTGRVSDWRAYAAAGRRIGPPAAPVTVVAFIDYECPFSRRLADSLEQIQHDAPSLVSVVYRNYPLGVHSHAHEAARAVECAGEQQRFVEYHQLLKNEFPRTPSAETWRMLAVRSGVADTRTFERCLDSAGRATVNLASDALAGRRLHVVGTPTLLVNDAKYEGLPINLSDIIAAAAKSMHQ